MCPYISEIAMAAIQSVLLAVILLFTVWGAAPYDIIRTVCHFYL